MKVLVTFALESEFAPWRASRPFDGIRGLPYPAYDATIGEAHIRVALTGVGREAALRVVPQALDSFAPDACVFSGLAGALKPVLGIGEILVANAIVDEQGSRIFRSNPELFDAAIGATPVALFLMTNHLISTAFEKRQLSGKGDAVDMEGWVGMLEAEKRGIPAIVIRTISDSAGEDLPLDFSRAFDERGGIKLSRVISGLVRAPGRLPALVRLGQSSRRAAKGLADFLDGYVQAIAAQQDYMNALAKAAVQ